MQATACTVQTQGRLMPRPGNRNARCMRACKPLESRQMNAWKFIYRLGLIACILLAAAIIVFRFYLPKIREQRRLRAEKAAIELDIQKEAEQLRMLKLKQEKLQEDPRFIEKIAREDLGYAKPGETVFRFVDEDQP